MCYNSLAPFGLLDLGITRAQCVCLVEYGEGQMRAIVPLMEDILSGTLGAKHALVILVVGATAPAAEE
jgi:hypothetical protein